MKALHFLSKEQIREIITHLKTKPNEPVRCAFRDLPWHEVKEITEYFATERELKITDDLVTVHPRNKPSVTNFFEWLKMKYDYVQATITREIKDDFLSKHIKLGDRIKIVIDKQSKEYRVVTTEGVWLLDWHINRVVKDISDIIL